MGPGFFIFFQIETVTERPAGGWEPHEYHPWKYKKRRRYELPKKKEERKALEIIEEVIEALPEAPKEDLELALRLRLEYQEITFKFIYLIWLQQEREYAELMRKREEEAIFLLLLH